MAFVIAENVLFTMPFKLFKLAAILFPETFVTISSNLVNTFAIPLVMEFFKFEKEVAIPSVVFRATSFVPPKPSWISINPWLNCSTVT